MRAILGAMLSNPRTSVTALISALGLGLSRIEGLTPNLRGALFVVGLLALVALGAVSRDSSPASKEEP